MMGHINMGYMLLPEKSIIAEPVSDVGAEALAVEKGEYVSNKECDLTGNVEQYVVHGADGPFFMDRNRWPKLNLCIDQDPQDQGGLRELTQEEHLTIGVESHGKVMTSFTTSQLGIGVSPSEKGVLRDKGSACDTESEDFMITESQVLDKEVLEHLSNMSKNSDMGREGQGWKSPKTKKKKKSKRKVVVATRTSSRVPRDGVPVATKATNRAAARNNITGNSNFSNPFTLLKNKPSSSL